MSATIRTNTSRSRFDEAKRFTGVYQRMGQVGVDADWNEEVRLRTVDARRRTHDLADGSPDDGFRIVVDFLIDPIVSADGWTGVNPPPDDQRKIVPELRLDRHDPETLPWVIRARWYEGLTRTLPAPIDLTAIPAAQGGGVGFAASHVVFEVKIERVLPDDQDAELKVVLSDGTTTVALPAADYGYVAGQWNALVVPVADFAGLDLTGIVSWGLAELPPVGITRVGGLRVVDPALGDDVVIRGGDGTIVNAGRILVDGVRVWNEDDLRYTRQPEFPSAPAVPPLPVDGSQAHLFYLDVWETTVTALEDAALLEPALDGVDTTGRLRMVAQVRLQPLVDPKAAVVLPTPTGTGRFSTNIAAGALPDRTVQEAADPCRDRCLFTENASVQLGYWGSDNLHLRFEVLDQAGEQAIVWSRDNGSTAMALAQAAPLGASSIKVAPADAARLRAGDTIVLEDHTTRLRWDAPSPPVLRRLRGVQAETGILELEDAGTTVSFGARALDLGGPLPRAFSPADGALVRRWDGADLLIPDVRYLLEDGITFAFTGAGFRNADYWTFTARVHAPDGQARGFVDQLDAVLPHGPIHLYRALARVRRDPDAPGQPRIFEDLRRRYLPLAEVRDRLIELGDRRVGPPIFTIVIGDGERSFGDLDQSLADGITADEALQTALAQLGDAGGSIFIRAGNYQLEHTVLIRNQGALRILGDGDATRLEVRGAGGAFYVDRGGLGEGGRAISIEDLNLIEDPGAEIDLGEPDPARAFELFLARRFAPLPVIPERGLEIDDLAVATPQATFLELVGARLRLLGPGEGRASGSIVRTLVELRRLQRAHPGQPLEDVPEAQPLLTALSGLPHGVITIADSREVAVRRCRLEARRPGPEANGVLITGACRSIEVVDCRILAGTGIAAAPYAPYLAHRFLIAFPRAGLAIDGLELRGNDLTGARAAATGIHLADGVLAGVAIRDNQIAGFTVGVLIDDAAESTRDVSVDRLLVTGNRLVAGACAVQLNGDGIDVTDNEIALAENSEAVVQAGIAVSGHAVRVSGSWIVLPSRPRLSPLGLCAGILVGDGVDDLLLAVRPVWDVEVERNRIDGADDDGLTIGVMIGGPQPIYDVRVKDNVLRNLGDAAVRCFSAAAPIGRLRVEGNRIERVALADVPPQFDNRAALRRLWPTGVDGLAGVNVDRPRPLLEALVNSTAADVRPALDAALRWVERLTLRGAIALGGVDGADVIGNRIAEVGRAEAYAEADLDGAEIRTAAIAAVACVEVGVADNLIEAVRAPFRRLDTGDDGQGRPEMLDVLDGLGDATDDRVDLADVHLTAADLRTRILRLVLQSPDRQAQGLRGLFGPFDALGAELESLGGRHAALAVPLAREIAQLRTVTGTALRDVLHAARATLSQIASLTAADAFAQDAWDACAQFDLAIPRGAADVADAARRILARADGLIAGLDPTLGEELLRRLRLAAERPEDDLVVEATSLLGRVAALHDQRARRKHLPRTSELVGPRLTIVNAFIERGIEQLDSLPRAGASTRTRIDELRTSKDALVRELARVHGPLSADLEADFRDVDRTDGGSGQVIDRMRFTLQRARTLIADGTLDELLTGAGADRAEVQARAAAIHLYSRTLDRHLDGLLSESRESVEKSLGSFPVMLDQLAVLTEDDPDVRTLAREAGAAVGEALLDDSNRNRHLSTARFLLDRIRGRLVPVLPELHLLPPRSVEPIERRLAGVTALVLDLPLVDLRYRDAAGDGIATHLDRGFAILRADSGARQRGERAVADYRAALTGTPEVLAAALFALVVQLDATAELARVAYDDNDGVAALKALTAAVRLATDPGEDRAVRLARVKTYVAGRTDQLSPVLAAQVNQLADVTNALGLLREALERLARGESAAGKDRRPPIIEIEPEAADGVFVAGAQVKARITGNSVEDALAGLSVLGAAGHVCTEPPDDGAILELGENRLAACAGRGIQVTTDGLSTVVLWDNHIFGCAGIALGRTAVAQAVIELHGVGDLLLRGNVLRENGNRGVRALLHEVHADWRGEVVVRGNTIRHHGGGDGGTGLMILADPLPSRTLVDLVKVPWLTLEPPPRLTLPGRPSPTHPICNLGFSTLASQVAMGSPQLELGGLRQALSDQPVLHRALTSTEPLRTAAPAAASLADRYLGRTRTFLKSPLLDFLHRPPVSVFLPRPRRTVHNVHIEGNDVAANGPALQVLSEGTAIWSTTVTGNELRSTGTIGAVYLRNVDSTVFTGNRVENRDVVTAVLIRAAKALISATGNVILSAQPIRRLPKLAAPALEQAGAVTLQVGMGKGALSIPIDARSVLGNLERRRLTSADLFSEIFADVITSPQRTPAPDVTPVPPGGATGSGRARPELDLRLLRSVADRVARSFPDRGAARDRLRTILRDSDFNLERAVRVAALEPLDAAAPPPAPDAGARLVEEVLASDDLAGRLSSGVRINTNLGDTARDRVELFPGVVNDSTRSAMREALPLGLPTGLGARTVYDRAGETNTPIGALRQVVDRVAMHTTDPAEAKVRIAAILTAAAGDPIDALRFLDEEMLGFDTAKPTIKEAVTNSSLIAEALADHLATAIPLQPLPYEPRPTPIPRPVPTAKSLVIIGGSHVTAVGNATTAGVIVLEADQVVELNL